MLMKVDGVKRSIERLITILGDAGVIVMVLLMALVVFDVFSRKFFLFPVKGAVELCMFMMAILTALGLAFSTLRGGNINVEIISNFLSQRGNFLLDRINYLVTIAYLIIVVVQLISYGMFAAFLGTASDRLSIPLAPFIYITALGFFMMILAVILLIFNQSQEQKMQNKDF